MNCEPLQASALSFFFESGEFAVILIPTAALSGCGFGRDTLWNNRVPELVQLEEEIQVKTELEDLTHTRPGTLVPNRKREGDERERVGGKKKNKTSKKEETSDNIRRWKLTWALCTDNAWQTGARKATWQLLHNMAAVFANTKTHSGLKQIIVYHGHETTLIVLLGLR